MKTLKKNYEFKNVLTRGKPFFGEYIKIYIKPNKKKENYIGIAVQTKFGNAVKRNRIKRKIRESYRNIEKEIFQGNDIVILCKNKETLEKVTFEDIKKDMINILKREK